MQAGQLQAYFATATPTPKVFCVTGGLFACLSAMGTFLSTNPTDSIESKDSKDVRFLSKMIRIISDLFGSLHWRIHGFEVQHFVWPFRGSGERRTIAANIARRNVCFD